MRLRNILLAVGITFVMADPAFAEEAATAAASSWNGIGAGLGLGLAVFGGALGQGKAAAAALEGISRNPGASGPMQTPMFLGLALIESLVILCFLVCGHLANFL